MSAVLMLAGAGSVAAQQEPPLFDDDAPLELTIELPLRQLRRSTDERPELDSSVRYRGENGREVVLDAGIRVRGKSRLEHFCTFPPLRLDFQPNQVAATVFRGQDELKLVTLCQPRAAYREYLAKEYLIYKALNALTDRSFRVRWALVEYVDTDARRARPFVAPAFFIEEDWQVAARTGLDTLDVEALAVDELDARMAALFAVFQFMIANTDWSATRPPPDDHCCHNGKPIGAGRAKVVVLPYDFDHAGLVGASYAQPRSHLPIRSVRERLYRGDCAVNDEIGWAVARFNERRAAVAAAFDTQMLEQRTRRQTLRYVDEFYEIVNHPGRRRAELIESCRE